MPNAAARKTNEAVDAAWGRATASVQARRASSRGPLGNPPRNGHAGACRHQNGMQLKPPRDLSRHQNSAIALLCVWTDLLRPRWSRRLNAPEILCPDTLAKVEDESILVGNAVFAAPLLPFPHRHLSPESLESRSLNSSRKKCIDYAKLLVQCVDMPKSIQPVRVSFPKDYYRKRLRVRARSPNTKTPRTSWDYCTVILNTNEFPSVGDI